MDEDLNKAVQWMTEAKKMVFFGGAGVSTESGIPDFRSEDGIYHQKYDLPPEMIISHSYFMSHPEEFYRFYRDRMIYPDAKPNVTHYALAKLEEKGKLTCVVTQNIDGLHQLAGSKNVIELHGSVLRNYCVRCGRKYGLEKVTETEGIPVCDDCGGMVRPDVVLYEESLDWDNIERAVSAISGADVLVVGGTSLVVQPAAGLIDYYRGNRLVLINRDATGYDRRADLVLHRSLGDVFSAVMKKLEAA